MKRGQEAEGYVKRVDFPNKGIVEVPESAEAIAQGAAPVREVTVKNVLPGQRVRIRLKRTSRDHSTGNLLEVLAPSKDEMPEPACVHFGDCGGCAYQNLPYRKQLQLKGDQVRRLLEPVLGEETLNDVFEGVTPSPRQFEYRNKMEFTFGDAYKDGPLSLGMHKRNSFYDIVTCDQCQIIDGDMRRVLSLTLQFFAIRQISFYHRMRHEGYLRHLLVRKAANTGEILVDLVTSTDRRFKPGAYENLEFFDEEAEKSLLSEWADLLASQKWEGKLAGVLHTVNDSLADVVQSDETLTLWGEDHFTEKLLGLSFTITPFSFFQTNSRGAEMLYETVREFLREAGVKHEGTVYDLYSGTGTIEQILAPAADHVIGVEIVEEAVEAARENAKRNHLDNCDFIAGDVLKVLDTIEEKPDLIVLDPPREGVHPKALNRIIGYGVNSMIYVSCKPTSLARDLVALQAGGYEVKRVRCVDMFPATSGIETVCLLSNRKSRSSCITKDVFAETPFS